MALILDSKQSSSQTEDSARLRVFPEWLKIRLPSIDTGEVRRALAELRMNTVCREAKCPNMGECYNRGTAAFMILGDVCTRNCAFCAIASGQTKDVDSGEPARLAKAVEKLHLKHVVITSVTRDDLFDEGASHFSSTILEIKRRMNVTVEVLVPDFHAVASRIQTVLDAGPDIFNHNMETTQALHKSVRPQALYKRSLEVLRLARSIRPDVIAKSGLMVGFGERPEEVCAVLEDLRTADVDMVTIGQYLQPKRQGNMPVKEYVHPDQFEKYREFAENIGFKSVACGPFVRSSYMADMYRPE